TDFDDTDHQVYFHISREQSATRTTFCPDESLGTIAYVRHIRLDPVPMTQYLRKTCLFGRTLSRKFLGSEGKRACYGISGNALTVGEGFSYLALELLASLTIMRHIKEHRLAVGSSANFFSWFF
ncbi:hypothetical protein BD779DRAFT_1556381, partial [Infundibulicybe gibba]